ncbi:Sua5/YciO/YrdC/YwlC family protein [Gammaproteobacteria bacterium]|nr:Sua5/YciO/YrdC/YwlC family protein [Gammaproteobacteria bacterium]
MTKIPHWTAMQAAKQVQSGAILAHPSEAVYGIGCDPCNSSAYQRILTLKNRQHQGIIVISDHWSKLEDWVSVTHQEQQFLSRVWPGPITMVIKASDQAPRHLICDGHLGIRLTDHAALSSLCHHLRYGLTSTSANVHGQPPARTASSVDLPVDGVLLGDLGAHESATPIFHLSDRKWLRQHPTLCKKYQPLIQPLID